MSATQNFLLATKGRDAECVNPLNKMFVNDLVLYRQIQVRYYVTLPFYLQNLYLKSSSSCWNIEENNPAKEVA